MTEDEAMAIATAHVADWTDPSAGDDVIEIWAVDEHSRAWVAHFATRRWLRTRSFSDQLVGSCPLVIEKSTGVVHQYGSGPLGYEQYTAWLDPVDN